MMATARSPQPPASAVKASGSGSGSGSEGWDAALWKYCMNPENFSDKEVVEFDDELVAINDAYPKALKHILLMPRRAIDGLTSLTRDDVSLLRTMERRCEALAERCRGENDALEFRIGFHAIPSMKQLHVHVISQDFLGAGLKKKHHWNSFTTQYFKSVDEIVRMLEKDGRIAFDTAVYETLAKETALTCHICGQHPHNMPDLKKHLETHYIGRR